MPERKRLSDILLNSQREQIEKLWEVTTPAADLKPIPAGDYRCRISGGALFNSRAGTPGYKITLDVLDGEHAGRRVWHDIWLSEAALSMAKRDLAKLGVGSLAQLERPLPPGIIVSAKSPCGRGTTGRNPTGSSGSKSSPSSRPSPSRSRLRTKTPSPKRRTKTASTGPTAPNETGCRPDDHPALRLPRRGVEMRRAASCHAQDRPRRVCRM